MHRAMVCAGVGGMMMFGVACAAQPEIKLRLDALAAKHPTLVEVASIGMSRQGRAVHIVRLTDRGAPAEGSIPADQRPMLVIVAGANPMHAVGVETALGVAERLADQHADALRGVSVVVIPMLNPDGFAWHAEAGRPKTDFPRTPLPSDADRDGRVNEDPAEDLNGDGAITMMRVVDPAAGSPWPATMCDDPADKRLMKTPDAAKGESPKYAVFIEGIDNDGDGRFNEDGPGGSAGGGVEFDLNAPYRWKEWGDGIGAYPLSEPEMLAFIKGMTDHQAIAAVLVLGPHDTLVNVPQAGRFDDSGRVPTGIEEGDKPFYDEVSKAFKDITKMTGAPTVDNAGSLQGWSYAHHGVWTFATPVWVRPDLVKSEEPKKDDAKPDDEKKEPGGGEQPAERPRERGGQPGGGGPPGGAGGAGRAGQPGGGGPGGGGPGGGGRRLGGPGGGGSPTPAVDLKPGDPDDAKWIKYSDEKRDKAGFIEWKPLDHPQLGKIEIGGFVPGFKLNPPPEEHARLADEQTRFVAALIAKLPSVSMEPPVVERVGPSLWRITARATNSGFLPSMPAIGVKARHSPPSLVTIDMPMTRIVSGAKTGRFWAIPGSGGSAEHQWVVTGDAGSTVEVKFTSSLGREQAFKVTLQEAAR